MNVTAGAVTARDGLTDGLAAPYDGLEPGVTDKPPELRLKHTPAILSTQS